MSYRYVKYYPIGSVIRSEKIGPDGRVTIKERIIFPPVLMSFSEGGRKTIVIPKLAEDPFVECAAKSGCYIFQNRGHYCARHRNI
jgi:hypothetical protein